MVAQIGRTVLKLADVTKRLKARPKTKKTTSKEARLVQGAGDKSDPKVGRYRAGQKQSRGGATQTAKDAMSDAEKAKLARQRSAKGSLARAQTLKKGSLAQLSDEYDKLTSGAKRAERMKGSKSKFYKVFKTRGMKPVASKDDTPKTAKKTLGGRKTPPKAKPKSILEGYKETKQKYSDIIDFKTGGSLIKKKYGGKITYKMTGGQVVDAGYD